MSNITRTCNSDEELYGTVSIQCKNDKSFGITSHYSFSNMNETYIGILNFQSVINTFDFAVSIHVIKA
jgi:hypothetical protein